MFKSLSVLSVVLAVGQGINTPEFCGMCQDNVWDNNCMAVAEPACNDMNFEYCGGVCDNYEKLRGHPKMVCDEQIQADAAMYCADQNKMWTCEYCHPWHFEAGSCTAVAPMMCDGSDDAPEYCNGMCADAFDTPCYEGAADWAFANCREEPPAPAGPSADMVSFCDNCQANIWDMNACLDVSSHICDTNPGADSCGGVCGNYENLQFQARERCHAAIKMDASNMCQDMNEEWVCEQCHPEFYNEAGCSAYAPTLCDNQEGMPDFCMREFDSMAARDYAMDNCAHDHSSDGSHSSDSQSDSQEQIEEMCGVCQDNVWGGAVCTDIAFEMCETNPENEACMGVCANYENLRFRAREECHDAIKRDASRSCQYYNQKWTCEHCSPMTWNDEGCRSVAPMACTEERGPAYCGVCGDFEMMSNSECYDMVRDSTRVNCPIAPLESEDSPEDPPMDYQLFDFCVVCQENVWEPACQQLAPPMCMGGYDFDYCNGICSNYEDLRGHPKELCDMAVQADAAAACGEINDDLTCQFCHPWHFDAVRCTFTAPMLCDGGDDEPMFCKGNCRTDFSERCYPAAADFAFNTCYRDDSSDSDDADRADQGNDSSSSEDGKAPCVPCDRKLRALKFMSPNDDMCC